MTDGRRPYAYIAVKNHTVRACELYLGAAQPAIRDSQLPSALVVREEVGLQLADLGTLRIGSLPLPKTVLLS